MQRLNRSLLVCACTGLFVSMSSAAVWAQGAGADDTAAVPLPDLAEIKERVAAERGLAFLQDVPAEAQSIDDFRAYMLAQMEKEMPADELDDIMDGLLRLGMLNERMDLGDAFVDAMASQAAAYYDPETQKFFYLMTDMPLNVLQVFAAHELVHALQDQHFGLGKIAGELSAMAMSDGPRNDDRIHAVRFLIEGEATYVMNKFQYGGMAEQATAMVAAMEMDEIMALQEAAGEMMGGDLADAMEAAAEIPPYIFEPLAAAYLKGAGFTQKLFEDAGGWEGINRAWRDLPQSTEQGLHPEKYTGEQRDAPTNIDVPEFAFLNVAGWELIDSAIHGELLLNLLLREQEVPSGRAKEASIGWDGDLYQAWRNEQGQVAIILATTWDTEDDAEQFFNAYVDLARHKYPDRTETVAEATALHMTCGEEALGEAAIVLRGKEVFAIEGFDEDTTRDVREALLALEIEHIDTVPRPVIDDIANAANAPKGTWVALDGFGFNVPAAWKEQTPESEMRAAQFLIPAAEGDDVQTELVIFNFGNRHGGGEEMIEANMDRWQEQFDWEGDVTRDRRSSNGIDMYTIDIAGDYKAETFPGSGEYRNDPDFRMLAAIVLAPSGTYYFKIVGPKATVSKWANAWEELLASVKPQV